MTIRTIHNASPHDVNREMSKMLKEGSVDPSVRQLAETAIQRDPQDHVSSVFDFVRDTFPYVPDPNDTELFLHPRKIAKDYFEGRIRSGDCDDHALLLSSMLSSIGYKTRVALLAVETSELDHAVAQVYSEKLKLWIMIDPSSSCPIGWEERHYQKVVL